MSDDIRRAREYGDEFRKYLLAALTGGIGITLSIAGLLAGKGVAPKWATMPIGIFSAGLIIVGLGLLMGEHRSLLRNDDPNAQDKLPWYKMGITWNIFALLLLIGGIWAAVLGLNGIELPPNGCQKDAAAEVAAPDS